MSSNFDDVGDFHEKFGLDNVTHHSVGPRELPHDLLTFRIDFMQEELTEFMTAAKAGDDEGMADALVDLAYVVMGTAHLMGLPWETLWTEVQRANMSKVRGALDGSDSKRRSAWDVVKPEGWKPPRIKEILKYMGWA